MTLAELIASYNDDAAAAKALGIKKTRTAKAYRLKERHPRPDAAKKIVAKSKGKLTLADCFA